MPNMMGVDMELLNFAGGAAKTVVAGGNGIAPNQACTGKFGFVSGAPVTSPSISAGGLSNSHQR